MNIMSMIKQHRRLLAAGGLLLILGAVYRFFPEFSQMVNQNGETDIKIKRLAKYHEKVQTREALQTKTMELTRQLENAEQALLNADTPALAAVEIQNILNEIIYGNQIDVVSIRVLNTEDNPSTGFLTVPVQLTIKLTVRQLLDLLHRIESSKPLLSISALSLRRQQTQEPDILNTTLTVEGYMKKSAS